MKAMKYMTASLVVAVFFVMLLLGCKKEQENNNTKETVTTEKNVSKGMLRFKTSEDFLKYLEDAETNNRKEGFVSFGKMADDAYYSIQPEEMFSSMDEIVQFVLDNRDLYQLILCSDGEYMVETRMYDHPFRNVANTDGIFQVGDTLYKIIEGGYAYTSLDKMDCLKQYVDNGYRQSKDDLKFYTFGEDTETEQGRGDYFCPDQMYNEKVNGNNKITLKITYKTWGPVNNLYLHGYEYFAKPYHKSIGWWGCNRTITANVYEMVMGMPGGIFDMSDPLPQIINHVKKGYNLTLEDHRAYYSATGKHISSCYCTANTPDAGTVIVSCN